MSEEKLECLNCGHPLEEHDNFCPNCGQKTSDEVTIVVLFYNTISNYLSFDAKFLRSFIPLMLKPGYLAKRFVEGKRSRYLHPGNMYLFVSVILFFLFSFVVNDWSKKANEVNQKIVDTELVEDEVEKVKADSIITAQVLESVKKNQERFGVPEAEIKKTDSIIKAQNGTNYKTSYDFNKAKVDTLIAAGASDEVIYKEMGMQEDAGYFTRKFYKGALNVIKGSGAGSIIKRMFDAVPIAMFILLPLFAFILKIFYFRRGRYAYHLVFSFYFFSFLFTVFAVLLGIDLIYPEFPGWISWLVVLSTFIYFYLAVLNFYQRHWFTTFIKSSIITFVFLVMIIPTALSVLAVFGLMNS